MSDRRGSYGRDRERSPHRGPSNRGASRDDGRFDDRYDRLSDARSRDDFGSGSRGRSGHGRGRDDNFRGRGGFSSGSHDAPDSNLPSLPNQVPVPPNGNQLPDTMFHRAGKAGLDIEVYTNHYRIQSLPVVKIYQYELRFELTAESIRGASKSEMSPSLIERAFKAANKAEAFGPFSIFNGVSLLWSPTELVPANGEAIRRVALFGHTEDRPNIVEITVRNVARVNVGQIVQKFQSHSNSDIDSGLVWLNALFRAFPSSKDWFSRPRGSSYFMREPGLFLPLQSTGGVLEALRGLHQAVSTHFNILSVNIDVATTAFYTPDKPLQEVLFAFAGLSPNTAPENILRPAINLRELSEKLSGMYFYVTHSTQERRLKKIKVKGLLFRDGRAGNAVDSKFLKLDPVTGLEILTSVQDYFQDRYHVAVRFPLLPLVESNKGLFPLEFCRTAPGMRYREVLEGQETADFIKFATSPAHIRSSQTVEICKRLEWHRQPLLPAHGVSVATRMLKLPAVQLTPPPVRYAQSSASISNGAWNLRGARFVNPKMLRSWGVVYMPKGGRPGAVSGIDIENFFQTLHREMRVYGMSPPNGPPAIIVSQPQADVKAILDTAARETCQRFKVDRPCMLFIFLHQSMPVNIYKAIKSVAECEFGIPTQCMLVEKTLKSRQNPAQYCANVCMKINVKLGGQNATVALPGRFANSGVMIVGADVTHPSPSQLRMVPPPPSIAALTGTFDSDCVRYTAVSSPQQSTQESISAGASMSVFVRMLETLTKRFSERNGSRHPPMVVYFRDGVSDSQIPELLDGEVKLIKEHIATFHGKLTVVLAQKRHHTRFFPVGHTNDRNGNIEPGTVVESGPGSAFVCGHGALQGTVRPSHFRVISDDNNLTADEFHGLIMHGVHSYSKATRAVHTHAAIYYADIVAERSTARFRQSGDQTYFVDVHDRLKHTMWWQ